MCQLSEVGLFSEFLGISSLISYAQKGVAYSSGIMMSLMSILKFCEYFPFICRKFSCSMRVLHTTGKMQVLCNSFSKFMSCFQHFRDLKPENILLDDNGKSSKLNLISQLYIRLVYHRFKLAILHYVVFK